ncbi:MAG TPA: hypothetical protein VI248_05895 [Kineosporiaceae bacterium]
MEQIGTANDRPVGEAGDSGSPRDGRPTGFEDLGHDEDLGKDDFDGFDDFDDFDHVEDQVDIRAGLADHGDLGPAELAEDLAEDLSRLRVEVGSSST